MNTNFRLTAVAAAMGVAFCGSADAATILGAGASAVKNSVRALIMKDYCASGTINYFDNNSGTVAAGKAPGGGIFRIQCTQSSISGFAAAVDIGYDTTGGSWKGLTAVIPSLYSAATTQNTVINANPVSTVATTGCSVQPSAVIAVNGNTFTVNYNYKCAVQALAPATQPVSFGLTDVEYNLFQATTDNQPLTNGSWATTSAAAVGIFPAFGTLPAELAVSNGAFPQQVFGVVFGIVASANLYKDLQTDQKATGLIPSSCTPGTVSTPPDACAPTITRAQYAGIVGYSGSALNTSLASLFTSIVPTNTVFELARRDQGSGTQASSNAYFLNDGCVPSSVETVTPPSLPVTGGPLGALISFNATTGLVIDSVNAPTTAPASGYVLGVISVENESNTNVASTGSGTGTGVGSGFLKLDGFYPSVANANAGRYAYVSEENLHFNPTATGDAAVFANDLIATTGAKVNESALNYGSAASGSPHGIVQLWNATLNPTATYGNGGQLCSGWTHL